MLREFEGITTISKSGKHLIAYIKDRDKDKIAKGDLVKITVLQKATNNHKDSEKFNKEITEAINKPNGEKLKGTIAGYRIEIPIAKLIKIAPQEVILKMIIEAIE
jgi:hypothetical protein